MWFIISAVLAATPFPCDTKASLEMSAEYGALTSGQRACLQGVTKFDGAHQADASQLLILDASARGDRSAWARVVAYHLDHIDGYSPELNYAYARFLFVSHRAEELIDFSTRALRHAETWDDPVKVVALHRFRTTAAMQRWTETTVGIDRVHAFAADWVRASAAAGQLDTTAVQICRTTGEPSDCDVSETVASVF